MINCICCVPICLPQSLIDGGIHLSMNHLYAPYQNFPQEIFCYAATISWEILEKVKRKCCINDLNINLIWGCLSSFCFKACQNLPDLGLLNINPSTRLKDNGSGVKGYYSTWAVSNLLCNDMYKMLPNKLRIRHADKTFPSDVVIFCFPVPVANEIIFCLLIGFSNRPI